MNSPNLLTEWARLLVQSLADGGIRDAVISPGSRSTPFAWAAKRSDDIECHSIIDERSAAFFALGQARITGKPSLLICTSGSAGAHYFPAVIEASQSGLPLVVLTADRPFELQDCAAPQTVDQVKLFGDHVRGFHQVPTPDSADAALRGVRRTGVQAVSSSLAPLPGPVHLNAQARKPLEPTSSDTEDARRLERRVDELLRESPAARPPRVTAAADATSDVAELCRRAKSGLILLGPRPPSCEPMADVVAVLAERTGFVVLAEATSQLRFDTTFAQAGDAIDPLMRSKAFRQGMASDVVLQIGQPLTSTGCASYVADRAGSTHVVLAESGWPDASSSATHVVQGNLVAALDALGAALADATPEPGFRQKWKVANELAWSEIDAALAESGGALTEGRAVRALVDALPKPAVLAVGNSLPVREVDTYCRAGDRGLRVLSQRGANGIDGLVSGAAGAATASEEPTVLLLGDVSLVHDVGGLANAGGAGAPLLIVVLNNGGGRIFEQLPIAKLPTVGSGDLDLWLTPHDTNFEHAAKAFGHGYARAETVEALQRAVGQGLTKPGCTLVEAIVESGDQNQRVWKRVDDAVRHWLKEAG